jgi:hypothetical protein
MTDAGEAWIAAMRAGRFEDAWALSERDLRLRDPASRDDPSRPYHLRWVWDGRPFDGAEVLIRCYHGFGDTIQFARYLPAMTRRASSVTVETQPQLLPLLAQIPGISLVPFDQAYPLKPADCDLEIMELAFALRMRPEEVHQPYLRARASERIEGEIGLCHSASDWDAQRCIPPELLATICRDHDCFSLVPGKCGLPVRNPEGCSLDIMETASLVASADLVITVDTMIAHLAGALGKPTWLLLKADPDWRWSLGRTSPWYPSMRLYRQPLAGDWGAVIAEVQRDLATRPRGITHRRAEAGG